jgi:hypothetical protein
MQEYINHFTVLINCSPQVVPLPLDLHEDLISEESVTIALMFPSESLGIFRPKLVAPQANDLIADSHAPLGQ